MEKLAEAIDRHARALESMAAALIENSGLRAGQTRSSKPIGTPVAFESIDPINDTIIDRSIESSSIEPIDRNKVDWEKVLHSAEAVSRYVRAKKGRFWKKDRALVWVAVVLVEADRLPRQWLRDAVDGVRTHGPINSAAYFRRCLIRGLMELDPQIPDQEAACGLFRRLEALVDVPDEWLQPKPSKQQGRPEAARSTAQPASEEEVEKLLAGMPPKWRERLDRINWSDDRQAG